MKITYPEPLLKDLSCFQKQKQGSTTGIFGIYLYFGVIFEPYLCDQEYGQAQVQAAYEQLHPGYHQIPREADMRSRLPVKKQLSLFFYFLLFRSVNTP